METYNVMYPTLPLNSTHYTIFMIAYYYIFYYLAAFCIWKQQGMYFLIV